MEDPARRASLLAALLTGQALASLGALAALAVAGLDAILFLAPVDWGLGFLVNKEASLAVAALLYALGTAVLSVAAHQVRTGGDHAGRWVFVAAVAGFSQLPAGAVAGVHAVRLARRSDFHDGVRDAPVLAGRGLRRIVVGWMLATAAGIVLGAVGVAVLFAAAPLGLLIVLAATLPQAVLLRLLDHRLQSTAEAILPAMPALPEWSQES